MKLFFCIATASTLTLTGCGISEPSEETPKEVVEKKPEVKKPDPTFVKSVESEENLDTLLEMANSYEKLSQKWMIITGRMSQLVVPKIREAKNSAELQKFEKYALTGTFIKNEYDMRAEWIASWE